jgi:hypothetical protein
MNMNVSKSNGNKSSISTTKFVVILLKAKLVSFLVLKGSLLFSVLILQISAQQECLPF